MSAGYGNDYGNNYGGSQAMSANNDDAAYLKAYVDFESPIPSNVNGNTLQVSGTLTQSNAKFGQSVFFPDGGGAVRLTNSTDSLNPGSGDWEFDFWMFLPETISQSFDIFYANCAGSWGQFASLAVATNGDITPVIAQDGVHPTFESAVSGAVLNEWNYIRFFKQGNELNLQIGNTVTPVVSAPGAFPDITHTDLIGNLPGIGFDDWRVLIGGTSATTTPPTRAASASPVPAPVANDGSYDFAYNAVGQGSLTSNGDSGSTTYTIVAQPGHGAVTVSGSDFTFTPTSGYSGSDDFTFQAHNTGGDSNVATVHVVVDPQPVAKPVPSNTQLDTAYQTAGQTTLTATGDVTGYSISQQPSHGSVTLSGNKATYTPANGFSGSDSYKYTATGAGGTSDPATVTVTVDAPVAQPPASTPTPDGSLDKGVMSSRVLSRTVSAPPATPRNGDAYIVPAGATGGWAGRDNNLAVKHAKGWKFYAPQEGTKVLVRSERLYYVFTAGAWAVY